MNIPLSWLAEYVKVPKDVSVLTDRLTMIGHMLDKQFEVEGEKVIDLELRGNRADLFGMIGIARDVSAAFKTPLQLPTISTVPTKKDSHLVTIEAPDLVERFLAFTVSVNAKPSPAFIVKRLEAYGIPSINNIVDITNYVMIESGEPMHAYDLEKLHGKRLIVRRAKKKETIKTLLGTVAELTPDDLVIADEKHPQGLTMIGGDHTRVTEQTTSIILEAAVYNQGNVRKSARRLGIRTEAGNRHEKHLDSYSVEWALQRALYLLEQYADAKITSSACDYFPYPPKPATIELDPNEVKRLTGLEVDVEKQKEILESLGFIVKKLHVTVPSFRRDIKESADVVEEIARIVGYGHIENKTLSGEVPPDQTLPSIKQEDQLKQLLVNLQINEVITNTFIENKLIEQCSVHGEYAGTIQMQNAPDLNMSLMRPTLIINMLQYAKRAIDYRSTRVAIFEIGNTYHKQNTYKETRTLGILLTGTTSTTSYNQEKRNLEYPDLKGIIEVLAEQIGLTVVCRTPEKDHPSLDTQQHATLYILDSVIGNIGKVDSSITSGLGINQEIFYAEVLLDNLLQIPSSSVKPYTLAPLYPPAIEDISLRIPHNAALGNVIAFIPSVDPIIAHAALLDTYQDKRTIRITYQHPKKTLSAEDIRPVREKVLKLLENKFDAKLVTE